jgi:Ring finger domain
LIIIYDLGVFFSADVTTAVAAFLKAISILLIGIIQPYAVQSSIDKRDQLVSDEVTAMARPLGSEVLQMDVCSVCLTRMKAYDSRVTPCGHVFHETCLTAWIKESWTCPMCRHVFGHCANVATGAPNHHESQTASQRITQQQQQQQLQRLFSGMYQTAEQRQHQQPRTQQQEQQQLMNLLLNQTMQQLHQQSAMLQQQNMTKSFTVSPQTANSSAAYLRRRVPVAEPYVLY